MDEAMESITAKLTDTWEQCARLLKDTEDPRERESRLNRLATAFVKGALFLRTQSQCEEEAVSDLVTDTFAEVILRMKPEEPSHLQGEVFVHAPATIKPEGVSSCQNWLIRYAAETCRWQL